MGAFKLWIFQDQVKLTPTELRGIERVYIFGVKVYLPAWFKCTLPAEAPRNDLINLRTLLRQAE